MMMIDLTFAACGVRLSDYFCGIFFQSITFLINRFVFRFSSSSVVSSIGYPLFSSRPKFITLWSLVSGLWSQVSIKAS